MRRQTVELNTLLPKWRALPSIHTLLRMAARNVPSSPSDCWHTHIQTQQMLPEHSGGNDQEVQASLCLGNNLQISLCSPQV